MTTRDDSAGLPRPAAGVDAGGLTIEIGSDPAGPPPAAPRRSPAWETPRSRRSPAPCALLLCPTSTTRERLRRATARTMAATSPAEDTGDPVAVVLAARPTLVVAEVTVGVAPVGLRRLREAFPHLSLLAVLPSSAAQEAVATALETGVSALVGLEVDDETLTATVAAATAGLRVVPDQVHEQLRERAPATRRYRALDPEQRRLADLVAHGWTTPQLARSLHLSSRTVKRRLEGVMRALGVSTRSELALTVGRATTDGPAPLLGHGAPPTRSRCPERGPAARDA